MGDIFIIIMLIILIVIFSLLKTGLIDGVLAFFKNKEPEMLKLKLKLSSLLKNRDINIEEKIFESGLRYFKIYYKDKLFIIVEGYYRDNKTNYIKLARFFKDSITIVQTAKDAFDVIIKDLEELEKEEYVNEYKYK